MHPRVRIRAGSKTCRQGQSPARRCAWVGWPASRVISPRLVEAQLLHAIAQRITPQPQHLGSGRNVPAGALQGLLGERALERLEIDPRIGQAEGLRLAAEAQ